MQLLEGPDDRLHELRVHGAVVVVEVDPARLAGDVVAPLAGVLQDRLAAGLVELLDAQLDDLVGGLDAVEAHRLELGGQAVGVPAEAALDLVAAHRLVARDQVLDVAGEQVAVVRQAVGEGRAVVEDELVAAVGAGVALLDARPEGVVGLPVRQHRLLDRREARAAGDGASASVWLTLGYVIWVLLAARTRRAVSTTRTIGCRGTTSLAPTSGGTRFVPAVSGRTRRVLVRWRPARRTRSSRGSPLMTAQTPARDRTAPGSGRANRFAVAIPQVWEPFPRTADSPVGSDRPAGEAGVVQWEVAAISADRQPLSTGLPRPGTRTHWTTPRPRTSGVWSPAADISRRAGTGGSGAAAPPSARGVAPRTTSSPRRRRSQRPRPHPVKFTRRSAARCARWVNPSRSLQSVASMVTDSSPRSRYAASWSRSFDAPTSVRWSRPL